LDLDALKPAVLREILAYIQRCLPYPKGARRFGSVKPSVCHRHSLSKYSANHRHSSQNPSLATMGQATSDHRPHHHHSCPRRSSIQVAVEASQKFAAKTAILEIHCSQPIDDCNESDMVNNLSRCCSYSSLHSSTSGSSWIEVEEVEEQTSSNKLSDNFGTPKSFYEIVSGNE
uniref:Uncharacterized protein n=1 Tax=Meloidogyne javanica TaxID=6303 RepID=A0A915LIB2_MELJA